MVKGVTIHILKATFKLFPEKNNKNNCIHKPNKFDLLSLYNFSEWTTSSDFVKDVF